MKNKKIIILFILVLLISIFGVSFALYNYNKTSKNSKLIVGDIYMHYKESDMSILTTAEDTSKFYYNGYLLNPNMKNQEYQEKQVGEDTRNELTKCADYFKDSELRNYIYRDEKFLKLKQPLDYNTIKMYIDKENNTSE